MPAQKQIPAHDELYQKYLKMQDGEGQQAVDNWILPNSGERFDDEAKAVSFEANADDHADMIFGALEHVKHKN